MKNISTATQKAAVMISFDQGMKIEAIANYGSDNQWLPVENPSWDWDHYDFRVKNEDGCTCQDCGKKYRVDLNVPDFVWAKIRPEGKSEEGGLLCGSCIMNRIEQRNEFAAFVLHMRPTTSW